jgi:hypothetical protein
MRGGYQEQGLQHQVLMQRHARVFCRDGNALVHLCDSYPKIEGLGTGTHKNQ